MKKKKKKKTLDKQYSQTIHARKRFAERFNIDLNKELRKELVNSIRYGDAVFIRKQTNRIDVYSFIIEDKEVYTVYDKHRKTIVTALYPDRFNINENKK
jgi:hypothetical protein